jgi:hypothetical protein
MVAAVRIIGIVGTAKNTGKTTVLAAVCAEAMKGGVSLALTSIGYDGEEFDNLTFLGKPRLEVEEGTIVATSEDCLPVGTAGLRVMVRTGERTPLGEVLVCRVERRGLVLLAGPNKTPSLKSVIAEMRPEARLILLDGAMNRIAPMGCCADGVIFTTGAARTTDLDAVAREMGAIQSLFRCGGGGKETDARFEDANYEGVEALTHLVSDDDIEQALACLGTGAPRLFVPSLVSREAVEALLDRLGQKTTGREFVFESAIALLASCGASDAVEIVRGIEERGATVSYRRRIELLAVTINPFYPRVVNARGDYEAVFVDSEALRRKVAQRVDVPVINIMEDGASAILSKILQSEAENL